MYMCIGILQAMNGDEEYSTALAQTRDMAKHNFCLQPCACT